MTKKYRDLPYYLKKNKIKTDIVFNDIDAWIKFPDYHHIYNKLWIAETQDLQCGPMHTYPNKYPIVFKPIINLKGMSKGFKIIKSEEEYDKNIKDGLFWEEYLEGNHYCIDLILLNGKIKYYTCLKSIDGPNGSFEYHESIPNYKLPKHIKFWIETYFNDFTGPINIETIADSIIECHLRLNGDFYLYNDFFVKKINNLILKKEWIKDFKIKKKFIFPIFVEKGFDKKINKTEIIKICRNNNVISYFFDDIKSDCQSEYLSRVFMFDIYNYENGIKLKNIIKKKIYN